MFNFRDLVSNILLEQDPVDGAVGLDQAIANNIITNVNNKLTKTPIDINDLQKIYTFFQSKYFTGEQVLSLNLFDILPVVDVIAKSYGGSNKTKAASKKEGTTINDFYRPINDKISSVISSLKPVQNGYIFQDQDGEIGRLYRVALKVKNKNILAENVWPAISNLTILESLVKIFDTRLTKIEKINITMNMLVTTPSASLQNKDSFLRYADTLIKDVYKNLPQYSSGGKKANKEIVEVLQNINVGYDDLLQLATYTNNFYEELLKAKFPEAQIVNNEPNIQQRAIDASLEHVGENALILAELGTFKYTLPTTKEITNINVPISQQNQTKDNTLYNLQQIEKLNTPAGKEIIRIIKEISTGIRTKESPWQAVGKTASAIGALATGMGPVN